jgi:hypothetical protein
MERNCQPPAPMAPMVSISCGLGAEPRLQILKQELRLLGERFLNGLRRFGMIAEKMFRVAEDHFAERVRLFARSLAPSLSREAMNSS